MFGPIQIKKQHWEKCIVKTSSSNNKSLLLLVAIKIYFISPYRMDILSNPPDTHTSTQTHIRLER